VQNLLIPQQSPTDSWAQSGSFKRKGSSLWLGASTFELPDLPGSTPLSLMLPIHQRVGPMARRMREYYFSL